MSECSAKVAEEEVKTQDVLKQVQGIFDKLTPHNFNDLMKYLLELEINTEPRLSSIIELILDKAALVRRYCPASADMCRHLMPVSSSSASFYDLIITLGIRPALRLNHSFVCPCLLLQLNVVSEKMNFHKLLLRRCQRV